MCPYCQTPILESSEDHIFSEFLGGKKTVKACKPCNNRFGSSFEGDAAKMLKPLHVSISTWGLTLKKSAHDWKDGHEYDGMKFNLSVNEDGINFRLSRPIVEKDKDGNIKSIIFATPEEANKAVQNAINKGKPGRVEKITQEVPFSGARFSFQINRELNRTALKMCVALSTLLTDFSQSDTVHARAVLADDAHLGPVTNVVPVFTTYDTLDALRLPLSHVIYVERSEKSVFGIVQFFGVIQLYCKLGEPDSSLCNAAVLGLLDPVTGIESIDNTINPLKLLDPPPLPINNLSEQMSKWLEKCKESAISRGAKEPPTLSGNVMIGMY